MAVGEIWRFSMIGDWGAGNIAVVTWHFRTISVSASLTALAADLKTSLDSYIKVEQSNTFYWRSIDYYLVSPTPPIVGSYTTGFPVQGTVAADSVGQQLAAVVTLRTSFAGRSYRGRQYWPGLAETKGDGTGPGASWMTNTQSMYTSALIPKYGTTGTDTDWRLIVWSKKLATYNVVASALVRSAWGVQRRRRAGSGA